MAMVPGSKKRKRGLQEEEEEDEEDLDRISFLPDGVLDDIVSLLPTTDGARTQVLCSRWRHIWRSAPLNFALDAIYDAPFGAKNVTGSLISRILSAHQGPGRRFCIPNGLRSEELLTTRLDAWLESPAMDGLQELEIHHHTPSASNLALPPPPESLRRVSSTLCVASFGGCDFVDGNSAARLRFPVLRQLSLSNVRLSESSLRALLAACPVLQSLLLAGRIGCSLVRIVCPTLRSSGVRLSSGPNNLQQLIIEDSPCLERLLCLDQFSMGIAISVISAPKLQVLGRLSGRSPTLKFGTTLLQGSAPFDSSKSVVHSVKVLSLTLERLSLDQVIEFMKCFPFMEKLYIETTKAGEKNVVSDKYKKLIGSTLDIRLKEIVLAGYRGSTSHANFAKFFVLNARMLRSMRLELSVANPILCDAWIDRQHRLLHIKNMASRDMQLDFASGLSQSFFNFCPEHVHDLSSADPFSRES